MAAYATAADLIKRYDERVIADLASDTGTPVADVLTDDNVQQALDDASGQVEAATLIGGVYQVSDLQTLPDNSDAFLKRLVCDLAMVYMVWRRPEKVTDENFQAVWKRVEDYLDRLRKGERLFNVVANVAAGKPTIDGPSLAQKRRMNLLPQRTRNFYPHEGTRLPLGRSSGI